MDKQFFEKNRGAFKYLENLRQSGITNMFGAVPYLMKDRGMPETDARKVLSFWLKHYKEIIELI